MRKNKDATIKINKSFPFFDEDNTAGNEIPEYIIVKSGLKVRVSDAEWVLLQNKGKGNLIKLAWLRSGELSNKEIELALLVFIHSPRYSCFTVFHLLIIIFKIFQF